MNKVGTGGIIGVVISIIIVMALFFGGYNYIHTNYVSANITDELGYDQSNLDLIVAQSDLNASISAIEDSGRAIAEADANVALVAWNGLKGLASTIRLFFDLVDIAVIVWNALIPSLAFLPWWVKTLAEMIIISTIVLLIIKAFRGDPSA